MQVNTHAIPFYSYVESNQNHHVLAMEMIILRALTSRQRILCNGHLTITQAWLVIAASLEKHYHLKKENQRTLEVDNV
jgi:hypothetical protein